MPRSRINDVELYHEVHGDGPPLVLIGGLGVHLGYWQALIEPLSARHKVVVFDHRGAGRSDTPPGPYSIPQMADDLLAILDLLKIEKAVLLGHSMGGFVALHLAAHHPERVTRLVLYSSSVGINWPATRFIESVERLWSEIPDISTALLTRIFTPWNWSPKVLADKVQVEMIIQMAEMNPYKMTAEGFRAQVNACTGFDGRPLLARIEAPALILGGNADLIAPPAVQRQLGEALPNSRLAFCEAGHNAHLEEQQWFLEQVLGFTGE